MTGLRWSAETISPRLSILDAPNPNHIQRGTEPSQPQNASARNKGTVPALRPPNCPRFWARAVGVRWLHVDEDDDNSNDNDAVRLRALCFTAHGLCMWGKTRIRNTLQHICQESVHSSAEIRRRRSSFRLSFLNDSSGELIDVPSC